MQARLEAAAVLGIDGGSNPARLQSAKKLAHSGSLGER